MTDEASPRSAADAATADLLRHARRMLASLPSAAAFLDDWPDRSQHRNREARHLPVLRCLAQGIGPSAPATAPLLATLAGCARVLSWEQTYTTADFGSGFLDNYGWTELIGRRGLVESERIACGFLMLGPDTHYPSHNHQAEELYVPLAGRALWMRGREGYVLRGPGEPIHHPAFVPHAMQTTTEPLVALYLWRGGDLAAKPRVLGRG